MKNELAELESAPEGRRNHTLFTATAALAELVNAGSLDEQSTKDDLTDVARRIGLQDFEIERTIDSAFKKTQNVVRTVAERVPVSLPSDGENVGQGGVQGGASPALLDRLLSPRDLRNLPPPTPLIHNTLDCGTTALLYGKWGTSKSFIALDWACSVATGRPWQGRECKRQRVLYVVAEGVSGFAGRLDAWETGWSTKIHDDWMRFLPRPVNLMMPDQVDALAVEIQRGGYGFIVCDTLARCMLSAEENSAKDAGIVVDSLTRLLHATPEGRGVVTGVAHAGKDGRTLRGSSAFEAGVDTVYRTERDGSAITLSRTKRKDGPESDVHSLKLSQIIGTDSCVIEARSLNAMNDIEAAAQLKKIMSQLFATTGVGFSELKAIATEQGMSYTSFAEARSALLNEGWMVQSGSSGRPFFEIVVNEVDY